MKLLSQISAFFIVINIIQAQNSNNNYFQQNVNYKITVELNDSKHELSAYETIKYTNNSNNKLDTLYFHLWPNAYKDLETSYGKEKTNAKDKKYVLNQEFYSGYIDSLDFKIDNKTVKYYLHPKFKDVAILVLNQSIHPGQTINICTPFRVIIPRSYSRLGYTEESFQITQWYPKPAVYDINGWHYFPYRDQGEFYSEYGTFEVNITVPKQYIVASTGNLETVKNENNKTTYSYSEEQIHDFAWFADVNLKVDIDSIQLPHSNKWVKTYTYYNPSKKLWKNSNTYVKDAIYYYSLWLGDYPYKTCKAILSDLGAGGGMEYPTITVIGAGDTPFSLETVIMHEIGHNWFYGMLGSNERDFPWMDEGLNSAYESRYIETKYPKHIQGANNIEKLSFEQKRSDFYTYALSASRNIDQAGNLSSQQYSLINYGTIVYKKNAAIINQLRYFLGDEEFDRIMKMYFEKWKFRHPQPNDFRNIFTENTDKNLDWFFNGLLSTKQKTDYKLKSIKKKDSKFILKIKNKKHLASPISIQLYKKDSLIDNIKLNGFQKDTSLQLNQDFDYVYLDKNYKSIDLNRNNNYIKTKGLFKKQDNISFEFLASKPKENITQIFYTPVMGYNTTNEFMLGAAFFSNWILPNSAEYFIMPMYSFGNEQISGETYFSYHFESNSNSIKQFSPFISSKSYGLSSHQNYFQIQAGIDIELQNFLKANPTKQNIKLYYLSSSQYLEALKFNQFINLEYSAQNKRWYNPFSITMKLITNQEFALLSADLKQELTYSKPYTGLKLRFFAGAFLFNNSNNGQYNLSLSGTSGLYDYDYQETFIGRNESYDSFWGHQFIANEGGFSTYAPFSSNQWMTSLTISSTLPIKTPLEFYFTIAAFEGSNQFFEHGLAWESGLAINIIKDMAIIYFPFSSLTHKQITETNALYTEQYIEKVRFTLRLNQWNIRKLFKNIDKLM